MVPANLLSHSREFEDIQGFIIYWGTLVYVDDHAGFSTATEKTLQIMCEFALSEGDVLMKPVQKDLLVAF